jgi:hypothetical protein
VQYFTILDKDGDDRVHIKEVLEHCFPLVDAETRGTLQVWLYPACGTSVQDGSTNKLVAKCEQVVKQHLQAHNVTAVSVQCSHKELYNHLDEIRGVQKSGELSYGIMCKSALIKLLKQSELIKLLMKNCSDLGSVLEGYHMHNVLGLVDESDIPNYFSATIFAITSAIRKLAQPTDKLLYRGFKCLNLPKGIEGKYFCEYGFFSTTSDEETAKKYAGDVAKAFLFEIQPTIGTLAVAANVENYTQ